MVVVVMVVVNEAVDRRSDIDMCDVVWVGGELIYAHVRGCNFHVVKCTEDSSLYCASSHSYIQSLLL